MDYRELYAAYEPREAAGEATAKQLFQLVIFGFMNGTYTCLLYTSSACGSAHFILEAPTPTDFTLTYSGPLDARDGTLTLTFFKLRAPG